MADWDFIGFTYNEKHSIRDLKIYRTSSSNRYDDNISSAMTDKTADIPGGDGQYYFGTTFKNRTFTINYVFDDLTESDIRTIKETFRGDAIHELIFDERPYMAWSAKVTGTPSMKHLCFEENGQRVYKGEGSITFTCYYPYAHTPKKLWTISTSEDGTQTWVYNESDGKLLSNYADYSNKSEWEDASGLVDDPEDGYNPGDLPTPFILTTSGAVSANTNLEVGEAKITILSATTGPVTWDSKTGLVYETTGSESDEKKTLIAYTGDSIATIPVNDDNTTPITVAPEGATLTYDYLYL